MHTEGLAIAILPVHVLAGGLALVFGYVAIAATKGATLHRRSGILFVCAMVTMSLSGALMEALKTWRPSINVVAGLLTFYFVTTGLLTVRRTQRSVWVDRIAVVFVVLVSALAFGAGLEMSQPWPAGSDSQLHLRHRGPAGRSRRHSRPPRTGRPGEASDCTTSLADVFCDVGRCRVLLLGSAGRESPR